MARVTSVAATARGGGQFGGLVEQFLDVLAEPPVVEPQDEAQPGLSRRAVSAARMLVSSSSYTRASAAARSTPASASTASVGSAASITRPSGTRVSSESPVPRLTAVTIRPNSAAEAARARPAIGWGGVRLAGGTTSTTCSRYTPRSSAARRCASPSSPHTTMWADGSLGGAGLGRRLTTGQKTA